MRGSYPPEADAGFPITGTPATEEVVSKLGVPQIVLCGSLCNALFHRVPQRRHGVPQKNLLVLRAFETTSSTASSFLSVSETGIRAIRYRHESGRTTQVAHRAAEV